MVWMMTEGISLLSPLVQSLSALSLENENVGNNDRLTLMARMTMDGIAFWSLEVWEGSIQLMHS
jgi:hypothetical protein